MIGTFTNDWISRTAKILFRGQPSPDASKFYVALAGTSALTRANSLADFVTNELTGYTRIQLLLSGDGTYNVSSNRHEMPIASVTFTAANSTLQFQTAFLLADAQPIASISFASLNVNVATDRITIAAHPWVSGDRLIFTPDVLSTLPTGINAGTIYQVVSPTTNDFAIAPLGSSAPVNIQDTGVGTIFARSANGIVSLFAIEPSLVTMKPGESHVFQIPLALLNTGFVSGN